MTSPISITAASLKGQLKNPADRDISLTVTGLHEIVRLGKAVHISTSAWNHCYEFKELRNAKQFYNTVTNILLGPATKE